MQLFLLHFLIFRTIETFLGLSVLGHLTNIMQDDIKDKDARKRAAKYVVTQLMKISITFCTATTRLLLKCAIEQPGHYSLLCILKTAKPPRYKCIWQDVQLNPEWCCASTNIHYAKKNEKKDSQRKGFLEFEVV